MTEDIKDKTFFDKRIAKFDEDLRNGQASLASALKKGAADLGYAMLSVGLPMAFTAFGVIGLGEDAWTAQAVGKSALLGIVAALQTRAKQACLMDVKRRQTTGFPCILPFRQATAYD